MTTIVGSTIGTGGAYSTMQAWEDAAPADLVAVDQIWQGQLLNQVHVGPQTVLVVSGTTTDSTRYKQLTTAAGASFRDNANKLTNALRYNTANGACISKTDAYGRVIDIGDNNFHADSIQIKATNGYEILRTVGLSGGAGTRIDACIIESTGRNIQLGGTPATRFSNIVFVANSSANINFYQSVNAINCTFVFLGGATNAITCTYGTSTLKNCAVFGATNLKNGNGGLTYTTSANDVATPPAGVTQMAFNTTTGSGFKSITAGTYDLSLNSTSALIGAGTYDASLLVDILGQTRSATTPTIGAWEYVAAGGAVYNVVMAETLTVTDSSTSIANYSASRADSLVLGESAVTSIVFSASQPETAIVTDASGAASNVLATSSDILSSTDNSVSSGGSGVSTGDTLTLIDTNASTLNAVVTRSDALALTDSFTLLWSTAASRTDTIVVSDARNGLLVTSVSWTDTLAIGDSYGASAVWNVGNLEAIVITDAIDGTIVPTGFVPVIPPSRSVVFGGGTNRVVFAGGTNTVVFDGGTNTVVFPPRDSNAVVFGGGTNTVIF